MTEAATQPIGVEGHLMNLRASLEQGMESPQPEVRGAVREMILELAERIRRETEEQ